MTDAVFIDLIAITASVLSFFGAFCLLAAVVYFLRTSDPSDGEAKGQLLHLASLSCSDMLWALAYLVPRVCAEYLGYTAFICNMQGFALTWFAFASYLGTAFIQLRLWIATVRQSTSDALMIVFIVSLDGALGLRDLLGGR